MNTEQKYIRLKRFNEIIIFHTVILHSKFKHLDIKSAGFCQVDNGEVRCYGESVSLKLKSIPEEDSLFATKQLFGINN